MPAFIEPQTARRRSQAGRLCSFPYLIDCGLRNGECGILCAGALILVGQGRLDLPYVCAVMSLSTARPEAVALPNIRNAQL
jgi:hypothetical protein